MNPVFIIGTLLLFVGMALMVVEKATPRKMVERLIVLDILAIAALGLGSLLNVIGFILYAIQN